jgi:predicted ferric reductase
MGQTPLLALERRLWIAVYACVLMSPIALIGFAPPKGADRWVLFAIIIGFVSFTAMVLQMITPSRAPQFTQAFGMPAMLRLHRYMGTFVLLLVAFHVGVFEYHEPGQFLGWLYPYNGPLKAQMGWAAAFALMVLVFTSWFRALFMLNYEWWRFLHIGLGIIAIGGAFIHILQIAWYSAIGPVRWLTVMGVIVGAVALLYLRVGRPMGSLGSPYVLREVVHERGGATTLRLEAVGHPGLSFRPGQFAWLKLDRSPYSLTEHPFSFASSSADPAHPSFTAKQLGDHTGGMYPFLRPGASVLVDGPHGAYEPALPEAGFVLTSAGIGITPAMSFLRSAADMKDPRPMQLVYGCRTWEDVTFREELETLQERLNLDLVLVLSKPPTGWTGPTGRIGRDVLATVLAADARERNHFVCGPEPMIESTLKALADLGIPPNVVYADRFDSV